MPRVPIDQILELPADDRIELAQQIWESVSMHPESVLLSPAQAAELERRWLAFERDPSSGEDWDDVKQSFRDE